MRRRKIAKKSMSSCLSSHSLPSNNDSELSSSINEDVPEVIEGKFIPYDENLEPVATQEEATAVYIKNFARRIAYTTSMVRDICATLCLVI